jgi:hypothetical protein
MKCEVFFLAEEQAISQQVNRGIDKHSIHITFVIWTRFPAAHTACAHCSWCSPSYTLGLAKYKYFATLTPDGAPKCNPLFTHTTAKAVHYDEFLPLAHLKS